MEPFWPAATAPADGTATTGASERCNVAVVGAGLTGLTTALLLARAGKRVILVEADHIGAGTTGRTTGKLSLLQGTKLSRMLTYQSEHVARAYVEANREGQAWALRFAEDHAARVEIRDASTYAATLHERRAAKAEHRAAMRLGLGTRWVDQLDAPVPVYGATVLSDQAQVDPTSFLEALAGEFVHHGGAIRLGRRVVAASKVGRPGVSLDDGAVIDADDLVLATGTPILDRGLYFAKLQAHRSYVLTYTQAALPPAMMLSAGSPSRSLHSVLDADGMTELMVGGNGHVVGRAASEASRLDDLRSWVTEHFPGAQETHAWSAQDYSSHDGIPYVGELPRGNGHIYVATGYDKWGMTNAIAAALRISAHLLGEEPPWAKALGRRVTRPRGVVSLARMNACVGAALASGRTNALLTPADHTPSEGAGSVGRRGLNPTAVATSTVDGRTCTVSATCTHLGGILKWNDAERSWDCPLHGSRFTPGGAVIEGPATRALRPVE